MNDYLLIRNGTSMISLIIRPGDQVAISIELSYIQISNSTNMLTQEYGTASNIKSRVNRLSVLGAITSTQQKLKLYYLFVVSKQIQQSPSKWSGCLLWYLSQ